jgi:predicted nucleic acid-binding protein
LVKPKETLSIAEDEPDKRILECAAESHAEFIVSEDNHLLRLERHGKARIVTSAQMLKILQGTAGEAESTSK